MADRAKVSVIVLNNLLGIIIEWIDRDDDLFEEPGLSQSRSVICTIAAKLRIRETLESV
jgi:hypothetical protein